MLSYLRHATRLGCALAVLACSDDRTPTAPAIDSTGSMTAGPVSLSMEPSLEQMASMPADFRSAATILKAKTYPGFAAGNGAYAQGFMEYFATDASQDVTLILRKGEREIGRRTAQGQQGDLLPWIRTLWTNVTLPFSESCGHMADGMSQHRAHHKFLVDGWKDFSWNHVATPSEGWAEQQPCPEPPPQDPPSDGRSGPGKGGEYEAECYSCQQWFWYDYGQIVDEWWECEQIDSYLCAGNLAT